MPSFIRVDLFPASVTVNGETRYEPCRAIVTDDAVYVYMDAAGGPQEMYTSRIDDIEGRRTIGYELAGSDGDRITLHRASGCGCGSRLKGHNPFSGVPHIYTA